MSQLQTAVKAVKIALGKQILSVDGYRQYAKGLRKVLDSVLNDQLLKARPLVVEANNLMLNLEILMQVSMLIALSSGTNVVTRTAHFWYQYWHFDRSFCRIISRIRSES